VKAKEAKEANEPQGESWACIGRADSTALYPGDPFTQLTKKFIFYLFSIF
jgi:hypothetical protein